VHLLEYEWRSCALHFDGAVAKVADFVSGVIGGTSGILVGQPLDVIKVGQHMVATPTHA
jgi:hypothetical protein